MKYHTLFRWTFAIAGALVLWLANAAPATAQQRGTIRGTVREASSQRPVAGVQVFVPGTQMSTQTDAQGRFELPGVPAGGAQVRVRAPGYSSALATTMVVAAQAVTVDFALNTSVIALDEVVVTGSGATAERKQLGNTIATVRAAVIQEAPVHSFSEALAAREAGVQILPSSGLAGEGSRIRIRGNASLSQSNEPVVYIDGVRVDNGGGFTNVGAGGGGNPSRLDDINPELIERVEILKGAAAATLYGSEASAGVIQIFTKKGTQGRPRFTFRVDQGISRYPKDRLENNYGFVRYATEAACRADPDNAGFSASTLNSYCVLTNGNADRINGLFQGTHINDPNGNGAVEPFEVVGFPNVSPAAYYSTGYNATYSATVSGGGSDAVYNVATRYSTDNGPYDVTNITRGAAPAGGDYLDMLPYKDPSKIDFNRRYQGSANVTMFPKERVTLSAGMTFTDLHHQIPENNNNIYGVQSLVLDGKPNNANCQKSLDKRTALEQNGVTVGTYGEDPSRPGACAGPGNQWGNMAFSTVREQTFSRIIQDAEHFNSNVKATYEPVQGRLRGDLTLGVDVSNSRDSEFYPFAYDVDSLTNNLDLGRMSFGSRFNRELSMDLRGNWNERFSNFTSQFIVGMQGFLTRRHTRSGTGSDFPGPGLEVADAGANQTVGENRTSIANIGIVGEEQIGYNGWAFMTFGGRWDRNSAFGENTEGAFYPKVNASLVISDMPSWNSGTLSTVRVRGALGRSGLQPGAFDKLTTFEARTSQFGAGLAPANLGNDSLKPEVTTEIEAGAELGLLQNRLAFEVTWWQARTKDALVQKQYPVTGGFLNQQLTNVGETERRGWELEVNALLIDRPGFSLNVFANGAHLFQRLVSLGGSAPLKVGGSYPRYRNWLVEGQAPGVLLGAKIREVPAGFVPFDTDNDKQPDTYQQLVTFLSTLGNVPDPDGSGVSTRLDYFNVPSGIGPLLADDDGDGDLLDNCLVPVRASQANTKTMTDASGSNYEYCLSKPTPDWSGAFGVDMTFARNFKINALFDFRAGNFYVSNLTDGFRNASPSIGRNNQRPAELEAIFLNPSSTGEQRADALIEYVNDYKELTPYDGMNLIDKADFLRFRELAISYDAPASFAQKLGFGSLAFNLSGRNLALFTGYQGIDPEMNQQSRCGGGGLDCNFNDSIDAWGFPLPRRFAFSVRLGF